MTKLINNYILENICKNTFYTPNKKPISVEGFLITESGFIFLIASKEIIPNVILIKNGTITISSIVYNKISSLEGSTIEEKITNYNSKNILDKIFYYCLF